MEWLDSESRVVHQFHPSISGMRRSYDAAMGNFDEVGCDSQAINQIML